MSSNELMYLNWQQMIKPKKVQVTSTATYGKFVCEPLERGYGITIGNALRRLLLSSLKQLPGLRLAQFESGHATEQGEGRAAVGPAHLPQP